MCYLFRSYHVLATWTARYKRDEHIVYDDIPLGPAFYQGSSEECMPAVKTGISPTEEETQNAGAGKGRSQQILFSDPAGKAFEDLDDIPFGPAPHIGSSATVVSDAETAIPPASGETETQKTVGNEMALTCNPGIYFISM
jgi:hypothetical protein